MFRNCSLLICITNKIEIRQKRGRKLASYSHTLICTWSLIKNVEYYIILFSWIYYTLWVITESTKLVFYVKYKSNNSKWIDFYCRKLPTTIWICKFSKTYLNLVSADMGKGGGDSQSVRASISWQHFGSTFWKWLHRF